MSRTLQKHLHHAGAFFARSNEPCTYKSKPDASSLLVSGRDLIWMYTANAATANKCFAFVSLSAWRIAFWHKAMSPKPDASSLLVSGRGLIWMYTANAATANKCFAFVSLSAWRIAFWAIMCISFLPTKTAALGRGLFFYPYLLFPIMPERKILHRQYFSFFTAYSRIRSAYCAFQAVLIKSSDARRIWPPTFPPLI